MLCSYLKNTLIIAGTAFALARLLKLQAGVCLCPSSPLGCSLSYLLPITGQIHTPALITVLWSWIRSRALLIPSKISILLLKAQLPASNPNTQGPHKRASQEEPLEFQERGTRKQTQVAEALLGRGLEASLSCNKKKFTNKAEN